MCNGGFTEEQEIAIATSDPKFALLASAGSGKTTVLVHRYLHLLRSGILPHQILAVTFTNEAADELRERILMTMDGLEMGTPHLRESVEHSRSIGTIHSFCYGVLNEYGHCLELSPVKTIVTPYDFAIVFEFTYRQWIETLSSQTLRQLLSHFSHGEFGQLARDLYAQRSLFRKTVLLAVEKSLGNSLLHTLCEILEPLFTSLEQRFFGQGNYAFDDLESLALRLLEQHRVADDLHSRFVHILVDEFQDTSPAQWEIIRKLVGRRSRLFIVGDPKQSIYRFRNADVSLFLGVSDEIQREGGRLAHLNTNFRSAPSLLSEINRIGARLFQDSKIPFAPMVSGFAEEPPTHATLQVVRYDTKAGDPARAPASEPKQVVSILKALLQTVKPREIALLFRVSDRIPVFWEELRGANIAATCKRRVPLFEIYDVLDIVNYLKSVINPLDNWALASFLGSPYVGLTYQELWELRGADSLFESLVEKSLPKVKWFIKFIESGDINFGSAIRALFSQSWHMPSKAGAFLELLGVTQGVTNEVTHSQSILDAIRKIEVWEREKIHYQLDDEEETDAVRLMTIHAAKGLEFNHVFLVDTLRQMPTHTSRVLLRSEHPPGIRYRDGEQLVESREYQMLKEGNRQADIEESKRILYVAMTRARKSLTLFLPEDEKLIPKQSWGSFLLDAS